MSGAAPGAGRLVARGLKTALASSSSSYTQGGFVWKAGVGYQYQMGKESGARKGRKEVEEHGEYVAQFTNGVGWSRSWQSS